MTLMEEIAKTLPPGTGYEWLACHIRRGCRSDLLRVGLPAARVPGANGQYESWYAPILITAVPLSLLGPMAAGRTADPEQPLYPDRDHLADRAVGKERHSDRQWRSSFMCATASRCSVGGRRGAGAIGPILMTSFAFILAWCRWCCAGATAAQIDRHHLYQQHDRFDLPRRAVRSDVFCRGASARAEVTTSAPTVSAGRT
jgi:hypothetical protein